MQNKYTPIFRGVFFESVKESSMKKTAKKDFDGVVL